MSIRDVEKLLDGPAGYAVAIAAAVVGFIVVTQYLSGKAVPQAGTNAGIAAGNVLNGFAASLIGPFADWYNDDPAGTYVSQQ